MQRIDGGISFTGLASLFLTGTVFQTMSEQDQRTSCGKQKDFSYSAVMLSTDPSPSPSCPDGLEANLTSKVRC